MSPPDATVSSSVSGPTVGADDRADLLALQPPSPAGGRSGSGPDVDLAIPDVVLMAYRNAARMAPAIATGCEMDWAVLAGIGRVESRHGLHLGVDTVIDTQGTVTDPIVGPALDGTGGVSSIADSDDGQWDGDATWDRAVGPMQFIPSSWRRFGQDGNRDGVRDPHNVFDAALAAAAHLCGTAAVDLGDDANLHRALFSYNHSDEYVATVRTWIDLYRSIDPLDVPRVAVRTGAPSGPVSPFPAPDGRVAGIPGVGSPLFPPLVAGGPTPSSPPSRAAGAATPVDKGPWAAAKAPTPSAGTPSASKGDPARDAKRSSGSSPGPSRAATDAPAVGVSERPSPGSSRAATEAPSPTPSAAVSERGSESERPSETGGTAPSERITSTPSPEPRSAPNPSREPQPAPAAEPNAAPAPDPEPEPAPRTTPAESDTQPAQAPETPPTPEPKPDPQPAPAPEPDPTPEPEQDPTPEREPDPSPEPEPASSVAYSTRPTVTYVGGAASDWPVACRPRALWASVVDAAVADQIVIATGVAEAADDAELTVTWRTARDAVWRTTTHGCE